MGYLAVSEPNCRNAATYLTGCFAWESAPEGSEFWQAVCIRLKDLARGARPIKPCIELAADDSNKVKRLLDLIAEREREIASLSAQLVETRRKLMISDWVNNSLPR